MCFLAFSEFLKNLSHYYHMLYFFYSPFQFTESFDDQNIIYPNISLGGGGGTIITIPLQKGDKCWEWFIDWPKATQPMYNSQA